MSRRATQGAAMLMTLVMLLVVGLGSSVLMQSALQTDRTALGLRALQQARQQAELGLGHCEAELLRAAPVLPVWEAPSQGALWQRWTSWQGAQRLADEVAGLPGRPQCLAETETLPDGSQVVRLTARGFSPDYRADTQGRTLAGAVAWQQSQLQIATERPGPQPSGAPAAEGFVHLGEGQQAQPLHSQEPASGVPGGCASPLCPVEIIGPGGQPQHLCVAAGACGSEATSCCAKVLLDRLVRPLLNPPQPSLD